LVAAALGDVDLVDGAFLSFPLAFTGALNTTDEGTSLLQILLTVTFQNIPRRWAEFATASVNGSH